jgi:hypothetical protein
VNLPNCQRLQHFRSKLSELSKKRESARVYWPF